MFTSIGYHLSVNLFVIYILKRYSSPNLLTIWHLRIMTNTKYVTKMSIRHPHSISHIFSGFKINGLKYISTLPRIYFFLPRATTYIELCQTFDISNLLLSYCPVFSLNIKLLYKLFALLYTHYIIMQITDYCHYQGESICTAIASKIKYVPRTLCLQSIIISRISSTILELCSKNIMFAEHNNFKL